MRGRVALILFGLIALAGHDLLTAPLAARAQQAGKSYRMGWLSGRSPSSAPHLSAALIDALRDLGWVETQNLIIDYRYAEGRSERLPALVADLLRAKPEVIYAEGDQAIKAVKDATKTVPIVMVACDAVAAGENLPRLGRLAVLYSSIWSSTSRPPRRLD